MERAVDVIFHIQQIESKAVEGSIVLGGSLYVRDGGLDVPVPLPHQVTPEVAYGAAIIGDNCIFVGVGRQAGEHLGGNRVSGFILAVIDVVEHMHQAVLEIVLIRQLHNLLPGTIGLLQQSGIAVGKVILVIIPAEMLAVFVVFHQLLMGETGNVNAIGAGHG